MAGADPMMVIRAHLLAFIERGGGALAIWSDSAVLDFVEDLHGHAEEVRMHRDALPDAVAETIRRAKGGPKEES